MAEEVTNRVKTGLTRSQIKKELQECSDRLNEICNKLIHLQNFAQVIMGELGKGIFIAEYGDQEPENITGVTQITKPGEG